MTASMSNEQDSENTASELITKEMKSTKLENILYDSGCDDIVKKITS